MRADLCPRGDLCGHVTAAGAKGPTRRVGESRVGRRRQGFAAVSVPSANPGRAGAGGAAFAVVNLPAETKLGRSAPHDSPRGRLRRRPGPGPAPPIPARREGLPGTSALRAHACDRLTLPARSSACSPGNSPTATSSTPCPTGRRPCPAVTAPRTPRIPHRPRDPRGTPMTSRLPSPGKRLFQDVGQVWNLPPATGRGAVAVSVSEGAPPPVGPGRRPTRRAPSREE